MSTVAATRPSIQPPPATPRVGAEVAPAQSGPRTTPADVVSISSDALAAASLIDEGIRAARSADTEAPATLAKSREIEAARDLPVASASPQGVDDLIHNLAGHNGMVASELQMDWVKYEAEFGKEKTEKSKSIILRAIRTSEHLIRGESGGTGIPLRAFRTGDDPDAPAMLAVTDFAFKSGGSRYEVTAGTDGRMIGTRDGQGWDAWQMLPSRVGDQSQSMTDMAVALQTLVAKANTRGERGEAWTRDRLRLFA